MTSPSDRKSRARRKRWARKHQGKRRYHSPWDADGARDKLAKEFPSKVFNVYDCNWTDRCALGETGKLHWHVGSVYAGKPE